MKSMCRRCTRGGGVGGDFFRQNRRCQAYSFRPNGYWPVGHPERMERGDDGEWVKS
jgi:hypothetical protein